MTSRQALAMLQTFIGKIVITISLLRQVICQLSRHHNHAMLYIFTEYTCMIDQFLITEWIIMHLMAHTINEGLEVVQIMTISENQLHVYI